MFEIVRFGVCALLMAVGLFVEATAVLGLSRFRFGLNRIHASGMGDSLGLMLMLLSLMVYSGFSATSLKLLMVLLLQWLTSPVSGHLIGRLVYETDGELSKEARAWKS